MRPFGADDWSEAVLNRPLTTGDEIRTGVGARSELHSGGAAIRLDAETGLSLSMLSSAVARLKLTGGAASIHIYDLDEGEEFFVEAPFATVSLLRTGVYRIDAWPSFTRIAVNSGAAEIAGVVVRQGQQGRVASGAQAEIKDGLPPEDALDRYALARDRREAPSLAAKRVPPRLIGRDDLDEHGEWTQDPSYGWIWAPRAVAVDWAPYRFGHWVWISPWGWTWIDDAPWGFAPFHYGRWVTVRGRWCWIPGPFHRHPVYAPALVVFAGGGGPGFHFYFRLSGGPGVAWFPLGPREVWHPPYRASRVYVTNVNVRNTVIRRDVDIHRIDMAKQRYAHRETAFTAMPEEAFRGARPVRNQSVRVEGREARAARPTGSAAPPRPREPRPVARPAPAPRAEPRTRSAEESRRDRQWEQRTTRETEKRTRQVETERRRVEPRESKSRR